MTSRANLFLILSALLLLLATPVVAQDEPRGEPTPEPLPTPMPVGDGPLVQTVLFFSPTCGHCHAVITETLPPIFADNGGTPVTSYDQSLPPEDVAFYLMSNGQMQILFVDTSVSDGQAMFTADAVRLDIEQSGVPQLDIEDFYLVGSVDIPEQFPGIVADALAGDGITWPDVPGLGVALAPFVEMGVVPGIEMASAEAPEA